MRRQKKSEKENQERQGLKILTSDPMLSRLIKKQSLWLHKMVRQMSLTNFFMNLLKFLWIQTKILH